MLAESSLKTLKAERRMLPLVHDLDLCDVSWDRLTKALFRKA
jgi:hypothetical protein